eukprot:TRINITY_DN7786_c0_g1_i3.p1 TRINITY_DN7786_c0_g1~~TRINITY_DN7786_c0_g1_i3.p1  ORF type:complete len:198 (+),score=59.27 TRINITY_DN7786_c0_g1_i3:176-769(+)
MEVGRDIDALQPPPSELELMFAMGHIADMLLEVVRDPVVEETYLELDETPVRHFAEFCKKKKEDPVNRARRFHEGDEVVALVGEGKEEVSGKIVGKHRGRLGVKTQSGEVVGVPCSDTIHSDLLAATLQQHHDESETNQTKRLLQNGEFQSLLEEVMEATLFEILQEAITQPEDPELTLTPARGARMKLAKQIAESK